MKYKIDTTTWKRREHYEFFNGMDDPFWGTVVPVDFTECYLEAKKRRTSFFLCSLHRILTAVNRIEAFRYRIENGEVVCYDRIHASRLSDARTAASATGSSSTFPTCTNSSGRPSGKRNA